MDYREALHIGSKAEGIIKCTYARLYDRPVSWQEHYLNYLFSLQRKDAAEVVTYGPDANGDGIPDYIIKTGRKEQRDVIEFDPRFQDKDGTIYYDFPMVVADGLADGVVVPAHFTPEAVEILRYAMSKMKTRKWTVYRVWDVDTPGASKGSDKAMQSTYSYSKDWERSWTSKDTDNYHHEVRSEKVTNPRFERIIKIIESGEPIYIKPAAFEWYPLDIQNATIVEKGENGEEYELNLDEAIAAAEERLNKAKAILIAAGFTNII